MPLTDVACRNASCPPDRPYIRLPDGGGLYLEVTAAGGKLWRWKFRHLGKEKRLSLGKYPTVPLVAARRERDKAAALLRDGTDPAEARQDAKRARLVASERSFEAVARRWWSDWKADKTERHARYMLTRLEADAFPELGAKAVDELTAPAFVRMAKRIEARGASELPRRLLEACGQVMRYAVAHGLAERNPVADVKPADVLKPRQVENYARVGTDELPELLRRIEVYNGSPYTRLALRLIALTFVRTGELIGARWQEFDLDAAEWRIPPERTKRRRLHLVPLSRQAVEALNCLRTIRGADRCTGAAMVFPGERDHDKPMSNNTILKALERMGYFGRMTGHGFRGVASTALNEMGYRVDVIEAQLAHVQGNKVRAAYNHAQYLDERRELMQAWADWLDAAKSSGKVIPFRQARPAPRAA
jgi:integrase